MSASGLRVRRTTGERAAAWLLTGPLGHLYAFGADVVVLWTRWVMGGARRRLGRGWAVGVRGRSTRRGGRA